MKEERVSEVEGTAGAKWCKCENECYLSCFLIPREIQMDTWGRSSNKTSFHNIILLFLITITVKIIITITTKGHHSLPGITQEWLHQPAKNRSHSFIERLHDFMPSVVWVIHTGEELMVRRCRNFLFDLRGCSQFRKGYSQQHKRFRPLFFCSWMVKWDGNNKKAGLAQSKDDCT